jgi:hypothetical protein
MTLSNETRVEEICFANRMANSWMVGPDALFEWGWGLAGDYPFADSTFTKKNVKVGRPSDRGVPPGLD